MGIENEEEERDMDHLFPMLVGGRTPPVWAVNWGCACGRHNAKAKESDFLSTCYFKSQVPLLPFIIMPNCKLTVLGNEL